MLLAGVGLLFATAIGGLATLQVARWLTRQREMAVRAAIGAGHGRLTRQVLIEQLIVGLAGGTLGLGLAWALHRAAPVLLPAEFPRLDAIVLDGRIALLAIGLALVATLLTSLLPIVRVRRLSLADALAAGGRTAAEGVFRGVLPRARALVIVAQVAITVVLLVGAGLVTRSFVALGDVDRGYEPDGVLTAQLASAPGRRSSVARRALAEQVVERLEGLPGVRRAAFASALPFMGGATLMGFEMRPDGEAEMRQVQAEVVLVSDGFVDAMGLRLVEGRGFDRRDSATSEAVVVVTRAFAREYLRTKSVGATLPLALGPNQHDVRVIGVVEDLARAVVTDTPPPQALVLASQASDLSVGDFKIVARTTGDAIALVPALQSVVRAVDASAAVDSVRPMSDRLASSLAQPRLNALLLGGFAGFALLVAGVGLFGVLSQGVSARRRELGVRLALGATPRRVVTLVVAQGVGLAVAGLAIGIAAALLFGGALRALLYGVTTRDPLSFGAVALTVLAVAALACLVPARRAAALDPLQVLRE
jgi:putative ABC transport system permease protein